jgi:hypothetical protein
LFDDSWNLSPLNEFAGERFLKMRKIVSLLDEKQREALSELADFWTAVFSAGLIVAILQSLVNIVL